MPTDTDDSHARKLVAILAVDVAGYSKLMADDEVATMRTLTAYREVFAEHVTGHKGRIVDTTGDSVMATFESVVEAVEAAVDVQRDLAERNETLSGHRKMHFRIGVNLGDIIVRNDGTIYGDGVNVAARLEGLAEPGGVMIGDFARLGVEGKLGVGLEDAGEHEVKNIEKPVRAWWVLLDGSEVASPAHVHPMPRALRRPKVIAGLAAALAVAAGFVVWGVTVRVETPQMVTADGMPTDDPVLAMPTGPSIAVLPFDNLSGDPEDEFFADGIAEDILTRLSRFSGLRVIARNSTFQYKGQHVDVRQVANELGVDYVMEGSVRRATDGVRITVQLLDGHDGSHVWAESYDTPLDVAKIFATQDEITSEIVAALGSTGGVLQRAEFRSIKRGAPDSLDSYECILLAYGYVRLITPESHLIARNCLHETVAREPDYAEAWAFLSAVYSDEFWGLNPDPDTGDPIEKSRHAAQRAIEIDPTNQRAHKWLAVTYYWQKDIETFTNAAQRTLKINPNDTHTLIDLGLFLWHAGRVDMGFSLMKKAISLTPNPPRWYFGMISMEYYRQRDYRAALDWALQSEEPGNHWGYFFLAMAYGQLGRSDDANAAVQELLKIDPSYATDARANLEMWVIGLPGELGHWMEGLELAGLFDEPEAPSRPVIAVLPFTNMSGDPEQEYFADGITEDIITRLAQFPDILVLGSNTTFQFKGQAVAIPTIAKS